MAGILEIVGWVIILGAMLVLVLVTGSFPDHTMTWVLLPWAIPTMICGLMVMVFARMLAELQAMRRASERQTELLGQLVANRAQVRG